MAAPTTSPELIQAAINLVAQIVPVSVGILVGAISMSVFVRYITRW